MDHGLHETQRGILSTLHEEARREDPDHLLAFDHQRYEEEVKQGLHDKKGKKTAPRKRAAKKTAKADEGQGRMF